MNKYTTVKISKKLRDELKKKAIDKGMDLQDYIEMILTNLLKVI